MREKQSEPLGRYLSAAYRSFFSLVDDRFRDREIDSGELHVLLALYKEDGRQQKELGETFNLDKATMARRLEGLESKGYVRREEDSEDRRRKIVYLTDKAREREPGFREILESVDDEIKEKLSKGDIENFLLNLKKLCRVLEEMSEK